MLLYKDNKLSESKIKKTIPFTIESKRIKCLGINLTKEVKDLYIENYKTSMTDIEEDTNKWKSILGYGLVESILLKCPYYPKQSTESM